MHTQSLLLALDFGGTKLTASLVRIGDQQWIARTRSTLPSHPTQTSCFALMLEMAQGMIASHPDGQVAAVGVSFGGPVDARAGVVRRSHHVPGWEDFPLQERLHAALGVPVRIENDANAGALGEWRFGAGRGCASLFYVTVSTGVGGGWVLDGQPYRGEDGMAGEIGHLLVAPNGPQCACGRRGCVEALASGLAIAREARERLAADTQTGARLRALVGDDLDAITAEVVSQAAAAGDELASLILLDAATALSVGIANALSLVNPRKVVLGGGVAKSGEPYWSTLRTVARQSTLPEIAVEIVPAALGDDAPLWGAIALAESACSVYQEGSTQ